MIKGLVIVVAATTVALTSAPAFGQAAAAASGGGNVVSPVTVTGRRTPAELESKSANCAQAMRDPATRALLAAGGLGRIYVATRPSRNPDYKAPPQTAPGSALPKVLSLKDRMRGGRIAAAPSQRPSDGAGADGVESAAGGTLSLDEAIAQCQGQNYAGGPLEMSAGFGADQDYPPGAFPRPAFGEGRRHIKLDDKTLPMGFALFDQGRYAEALEWFKKAYKKLPDGDGGGEASLMIGKIYLYGLGDKSDPVQAVTWLKKAAGQRFDSWAQMPIFDPLNPDRNTDAGEANLILADLYRTGKGPVAKDIDKSIGYLKRAVSVGHVPAAKMLGDVYHDGVETPRDLKTAFKNYMDGARFAHAPAMNAVAQMYETGEAPGGPDPKKALAWRAEGAKRNDPEALYTLAIAYERGTGVEADPERALDLYKVAAINGHAGAQAAIGAYFYRGEAGMPQDPVLARRWFEHAAVGGDADGMFDLAAMLAKGEGGEVDRVKAWAWFRIADRLGHENAAAAAKAIEAQMTPQDRAGIAELTAKKAG